MVRPATPSLGMDSEAVRPPRTPHSGLAPLEPAPAPSYPVTLTSVVRCMQYGGRKPARKGASCRSGLPAVPALHPSSPLGGVFAPVRLRGTKAAAALRNGLDAARGRHGRFGWDHVGSGPISGRSRAVVSPSHGATRVAPACWPVLCSEPSGPQMLGKPEPPNAQSSKSIPDSGDGAVKARTERDRPGGSPRQALAPSSEPT